MSQWVSCTSGCAAIHTSAEQPNYLWRAFEGMKQDCNTSVLSNMRYCLDPCPDGYAGQSHCVGMLTATRQVLVPELVPLDSVESTFYSLKRDVLSSSFNSD